MQYVITKDFLKLKKFLQRKRYSIDFDGSKVDVLVASKKNTIDINEERGVLCDNLSKFTIGYDVRSIVLPSQDYKCKAELQTTPSLLVCWDAERMCFWISGPQAEIEKTYMSFRANHPDLWKFTTGLNISIQNESDRQEKIVKWDSCEILISINVQGRLISKCVITIDITHFVRLVHIQYAQMKNEKLIKRLHDVNTEVTNEFSYIFTTEFQQFHALSVAVTNSVIHVLSRFDSKSIQVPQNIVEDVKKNLTTFDDILLFWERDYSMVWVTGLSTDVKNQYAEIATSVDDRKIRLDRAQVHKIIEKDEIFENVPDRINHYVRIDRDIRQGASHIFERGITEDHFRAMKFFFGNEKEWQSIFIQWKDGQLIAQIQNPSQEKYLEDKYEKVQTMINETVSIKKNVEKIETTLAEQREIFFFISGSEVILMGENYIKLIALKQQIQLLASDTKVTNRRNRRFVTDDDNNTTSGSQGLSSSVTSTSGSGKDLKTEFGTIEGIKVKVYSASILSLSVDCIVNAANENLSHGGGVAAVIADAAGYQLEIEGRDYIYQYGPISVGRCCSTTAGKLTHYRCVIHTVGPRWSDYRNKEECRDVLKRSVYVCLKEASQKNLTSIGIPPISAGIFGVPKEICATEYYNAVAEFSKKYGSKSSLQEVHFIDKDDQMVKFIRDVFTKCFSGGVSDFSTSKYSAKTTASYMKSGFGDHLGTSTRSHSLPSSADQSVFVSKTKKRVYIHKTDICSIAVDAIVCPQDRAFSGREHIAKLLYKKAGTKYQNEIDNIVFCPLINQTKVFKTYGSLPSRFVFHTIAPRWDNKRNSLFENYMQKTIEGIFTCCEEENVKSLALPLIGLSSDGIDRPLSIFGKVLVKKLKQVFDSNMSLPEEVHIVCSEETGHGITRIKELLQSDSFFREESYKKSASATPPSSPSSFLGQTLYGGSVSEDCCICMDKCTNPKRLACGHIFCKECIDMQFTYKPTCPACGKVFGKLTGNQPNGTITFKRHGTSLPGYYPDGTIEVMYNIYGGTQGDEHPNPGSRFEGIRQSGFLPDNEDGRKVAKLLNVAFSRKLVFTIGTSRTTEKEGVVNWNDIHHKTRHEGGTERFGYPDPSYISRVLDELSVKGVTEESADDPNEFKEYLSVISRR